MKRRLAEVVLCFSRSLTEQGGPHGGLANRSACLQDHQIYNGAPNLAVLRADLLFYENTKEALKNNLVIHFFFYFSTCKTFFCVFHNILKPTVSCN